MRPVTKTILISLLALATCAFAQDNPPQSTNALSNAKSALEKLKTLSGSWSGEIMKIPITFTIRAASSGTAVVHEGNTEGGGPPNHEITMFYIEGERLLSTHYCDAGNQSHMEGKMSPDGKSLKFSFLDVVGSKKGGYLKDMTFTWVDVDHHVLEVTFVMPNGNPIPLRGEFTKSK